MSSSDGRGGVIWGVDPSTLRVAIAVHGVGVFTHSFTPAEPRSGRRLAIIHGETGTLARRLVLELGRPEAVFVEEPGGVHVEPQLRYAVGCIMAALAGVCRDVRLVTVPSWKKRSVGHGHAKKRDVMRWARQSGYEGALQDEADAWGIAAAGAVIVAEPDPRAQLSL